MKPRTCFACIHHHDIADADGISSLCGLFAEPIDHEEVAAADCEDYQTLPEPADCTHTATHWQTRNDTLGWLAWSTCLDCGCIVTTLAKDQIKGAP